MRQKVELALSIFLVIGLIGASYAYQVSHKGVAVTQTRDGYVQTIIHLKGIPLVAKVSDTEPLREQGLSGTPSLPQGQAMLFVFQKPDYYDFWMKDMNYPIDMIWLNDAKQVVFVKEHASPDSYPDLFKPETKALYVIEVPDGFVSANSIQQGDQAQFEVPGH